VFWQSAPPRYPALFSTTSNVQPHIIPTATQQPIFLSEAQEQHNYALTSSSLRAKKMQFFVVCDLAARMRFSKEDAAQYSHFTGA
jgi:hypothetical protein